MSDNVGAVAVNVTRSYKKPLAGMSSEARTSIEANLSMLLKSVDQLITELSRVGEAIPYVPYAKINAAATSADPAFTGQIGLPVHTVDPGNPADGEAKMFVLVNPGVQADLIVRYTDGATLRQTIISLP